MPHTPEEAMLAATLHIFNAVERACALPPRSAVSPLRVVPPEAAPIKFLEDSEKACSYCGEPVVYAEDEPFCSRACGQAYCRWIDGDEPQGPHGQEGR